MTILDFFIIAVALLIHMVAHPVSGIMMALITVVALIIERALRGEKL
jgi:hypothetical protein